jgi:hypothetical protein
MEHRMVVVNKQSISPSVFLRKFNSGTAIEPAQELTGL